MKNIIKIFSITLFLLYNSLMASDATSFEVNGLKIILKENSANDIISTQLFIKGGVYNLTEATQGIEPLIFASMVKGSKNYPKDELNAIIDKTAAAINGAAGKDFSSISLRTVKKSFDQTWNVFTDVIMNPLFDPAEVELERQNLLLNIKQRNENPDTYLNELADKQFYKNHPYILDPRGSEESVANISIDQMRAYLKDNLSTSQLLLVVVGNVNKSHLKELVKNSFGTLPKGNYTAKYPDFVEHNKASLITEQRDIPTNYIIGNMSAPNMSSDDYYPMVIGMSILGSRVWEEVRTKRNLSYAPDARFRNSFANRAFIYVTAVDPDTTIKVMLNEVKKIQNEAVTQKDLTDRTTMYLTRYYYRNETNAAQGNFLARFELSGVGWEKGAKYVESLRKVTVKDVQHVAQKYLKNIQFSVLGNPELIDEALFTSL